MKDSFVINKIKFTIETKSNELYEEQRDEVNKFVTRREKDFVDEMNIEYTKDRALFEKLKKGASKLENLEKIQTFAGEYHYKMKNIDVYVKDNGEYYAFVINNQKVVIVGNPDLNTREFPFRIVREILVRKMEDQKKIFTHATGVCVGGKGFCIIAGSGSGKTTLATILMEDSKNVKFISNDRVFVESKNGGLTMSQFPIPIVYAMGTVKGSPKLTEYFNENKLTEKVFQKKLVETQDKQKLEFELTAIENVFDCELINEHKIDVIIIPKFNKNLNGNVANVSIVDKTFAEAILKQNSFTPYDTESKRSEWIIKRQTTVDDLIKNQKEVINEELKMPIVYVEYGIESDYKVIMESINKTLSCKEDGVQQSTIHDNDDIEWRSLW